MIQQVRIKFNSMVKGSFMIDTKIEVFVNVPKMTPIGRLEGKPLETYIEQRTGLIPIEDSVETLYDI